MPTVIIGSTSLRDETRRRGREIRYICAHGTKDRSRNSSSGRCRWLSRDDWLLDAHVNEGCRNIHTRKNIEDDKQGKEARAGREHEQ